MGVHNSTIGLVPVRVKQRMYALREPGAGRGPRHGRSQPICAAPLRSSAVGLVKEFKAFLVRGNVVDLAVAFVMGAAFTVVVSDLVKDLITPIIAAVFGKPDFSQLFFTINASRFLYGDFLDGLITFVSVAAAVFFFVVKPINAMAAARARGQAAPDPTTKQCTECLSEIPVAAARCAFCAQPQAATASP